MSMRIAMMRMMSGDEWLVVLVLVAMMIDDC